MSIYKQQGQRPGLPRGWGAIRALLVAGAIVAALGAIFVSPLLFRVLTQHTTGWTEMANVGEAYGGIAALLSGLALGGVAISLLLQWRQSYAERTLAVRQHHIELIKLGIAEPLLLGRTSSPALDRETAMLHINANLWVAHWAMLWDLKYCDEAQLRHLVSQLFASDAAARDWWHMYGPMWSVRMDRRRRRFQEIVTDEWHRAVWNAPVIPDRVPTWDH